MSKAIKNRQIHGDNFLQSFSWCKEIFIKIDKDLKFLRIILSQQNPTWTVKFRKQLRSLFL